MTVVSDNEEDEDEGVVYMGENLGEQDAPDAIDVDADDDNAAASTDLMQDRTGERSLKPKSRRRQLQPMNPKMRDRCKQ